MPTELVTVTRTETVEVPLRPTGMIDNDGVPLESLWHRDCINLLIESVEVHRAGRQDFFCGGNMFLYFSEQQVRDRDYRGPDFFFVDGVPHDPPRPYWAVWNEGGRYPDAIVELLSPSTAQEDRTTKFRLYERTFHTSEYFLYDPATRQLEGWRLGNGTPAEWAYRRLEPGLHGRLWSARLGLWLGTAEGEYLSHRGVWLRLYETDGRIVPTLGEQAKAERQRAEAERQRAEAERQRAEAERQRAEAAEAEIARLRTEIDALRNPPAPGS